MIEGREAGQSKHGRHTPEGLLSLQKYITV
jgi:hypothetical protein